MRALFVTLSFALATVIAPGLAAAQQGLPDRRVAISRDVDYPGGDLRQIFDTTLDACQAACLADDRCVAFTFNQRANSCFPKGSVGSVTPYRDAISGRVFLTDPATLARAAVRRADLGFLDPADFAAARDLAERIGRLHSSDEFPAADLLAAARQSEAADDLLTAMKFTGAALSLTDRAEQWRDYARLAREAWSGDAEELAAARTRVLPALVAAYLRADDDRLRADILIDLAQALEDAGRGRAMIPALRLARQIAPGRDVDAMLDRAVGLYGFGVEGTEVQSDSATPRLCVTFNEPLAQAGVDYAPFVQLPDVAFTVEVSGAQLCLDGVAHGQRYRLILREGLPAASGEVLARPVDLTLYVRDRTPSVRFLSRGFVLPRAGEIAIPVRAVNLDRVDLRLGRLSDRNLIRTMQEAMFGQPLYPWQEEYFARDIGELVWEGSAEVGSELNRDVLTRIPLGEVLAGQPAGIYVLTAAVPGADPYVTPPAAQWFVLTDLGVMTWLGNDGLTVGVRSLADAAAVAGAEVTLLSRANAVLGTATTDADGVARFDAGLTRGTGGAEPALVTVTGADGDLAFVALNDPAFDLSDRGVAGRAPAGPIDVFLATDRGAYRAGETIHLTALMRDAGARALPGIPLTAILYRPDGVEYSRTISTADAAGGHVYALPVAGTAPRGTWRIEVKADLEAPPLATARVLVEDFLPERIDVALTVPASVGLSDPLPIDLAATYLFGPPAADLSVEGEVLLRAASGLPDWPGYVFGRHDEPFDARMSFLESARTDAEGRGRLFALLPEVQGGVSQPLEAVATIRLSEGSGRPVERQATALVLPDLPLIGIRPLFDGVVPENGEARFALIAIDPGAKAPPLPVRWTVNRLRTDYQWFQMYGEWNWEPVVTRERIATGEARLGTVPVEVAVPVTWGEYEIVVERRGGADVAASTAFAAGWYAADAADAGATPDLLETSLDAAAYAPGDTATLRIVPRFAGTAIVAVLADRVIDLRAVPVTEGENLIPLPVTDAWGAGAYVTASVIRGMDVPAGRNPARALGLAHAGVDPGDRALSVAIEAPPAARPRGPLPVGIAVQGVAPGEQAWVTLAAVDVGILNMTGFRSPDPQAYYFGQRKLGVELRDLYGRLIDGLNGALGRIRSGGDAMGPVGLQSPPPTEELVAFFTGPLPVGPDGRAELSLDLPAFNGTVRLMALAWSDRGVGQAQADVRVRDPVVVTASVPRFLAPGDTARLRIELVHAEGPAGEMPLAVSSEGLRLDTAAIPAAVTLAEGGRHVLTVPVTAGATGLQRIAIALTTPDGQVLERTLTIPVQVNDPATAQTLRLSLAPGETFTFDDAVFDGLRAGTGSATLSVGPLARFDAAGLLAALDRYPYGCTEQITSQAMPLLYFGDVAAAMGLAQGEAIGDRIDRAITAVLANQAANGSFGLWEPSSGDLWLDAYVTDFLSRARARGHAVPEVAWSAALANLRNQVNYYPDFESGGEALSYALMVLAREGAAAVGDLRYFADERAFAFTTPLASAQLGAALAQYGDQARADRMFDQAQRQIAGLPSEPKGQSVWRVDYGTDRRDAAAVLALAVEAGSNAVDRDLLTLRATGTGGAVSTQEAAWALMAAHALIDDLRGAGITVNGAPPEGPVVGIRAANAAAAPLRIANTGTAATDLTVTVFGVPATPEPAGGNGYAIRRAWYSLAGEEVDPATVRAGTRLVTVLTVEPFGRQEARLIVNDPLPAGFEIDNPNLLRGGDLSGLPWLDPVAATHAEFRQDRFLAAVDLLGTGTFRLAYIVRAVSPGSFHLPAASVEDMYRPAMRAWTDAGRVTVTE